MADEAEGEEAAAGDESAASGAAAEGAASDEGFWEAIRTVCLEIQRPTPPLLVKGRRGKRQKWRPAMGSKVERDMAGERPKGGSAKNKCEEKRHKRKTKMNSLKMTMMAYRREILWKLGGLIRKQNRRRLGEEEEAAILLMAISSGFVYA